MLEHTQERSRINVVGKDVGGSSADLMNSPDTSENTLEPNPLNVTCVTELSPDQIILLYI